MRAFDRERRSSEASVSHLREKKSRVVHRRNQRRVLRTNGRTARFSSTRRGQARPHHGSLHPEHRAVVAYTSRGDQSGTPANIPADQSHARHSRAAAIHPATARKRSSHRIVHTLTTSIYCRRKLCAKDPVISRILYLDTYYESILFKRKRNSRYRSKH